mgnify:CR=1 FL=1
MSNILKLTADTIVVLDRPGMHTFVCFQYADKSLTDAAQLLTGEPVQIELSDGNGDFVNGRTYSLTRAYAPNRHNTIGGRDNVLIVEAETI